MSNLEKLLQEIQDPIDDAEIIALEKKYGYFYAPTFEIWIDGQDIVKQKNIEIVSVSVDNTLDGADTFTFTVNNAFDIINREVLWLDDPFQFGKQVKIWMGYANSTNGLSLMIVGLITSIKTNFPSEGAPQMEVSGFDLSYKLMKETKTRLYPKSTKFSKIAEDIVNDTGVPLGLSYLNYSLKYSTADTENKPADTENKPADTNPFKDPSIEVSDDNDYPQITKNTRESDFDFLTRLAQRIYYDFFVFNSTLYFRRPAIDEKPVVTLVWGKSLVSFSPEQDISGIPPGIVVTSRNTDTNKNIAGIAYTKNQFSPDDEIEQKDVTEILKEALGTSQGEDQILRVDVIPDTVSSQRDAENLAKALLQKKIESLLKGTGESIGIPEILAGKNIQLNGLGIKFNTSYYVERSNHSITNSGYRTTFNVNYKSIVKQNLVLAGSEISTASGEDSKTSNDIKDDDTRGTDRTVGKIIS